MQRHRTRCAMSAAVCGIAVAAVLQLQPALGAEACSEVKVMGSAGPETDFVIKYAAANLEKATGVKAQIDIVARDIQAQRETAEFVGDAGQYDIIFIGGGEDKQWVGRAHSVDLNKFLPASELAKLIPSIRALATMEDGKLVGVPQYWNAPMYFYRKDLFSDSKNQADFKAKYGYELAPPQTWDQLVDIAEFFNRPPSLYGGFLSGIAWAAGYDYLNVLYGVGGNPSDLKTNAMLLGSPESVKAFTIIQKLSKVSPPGFQTASFFDGDKLIQGGKLAAYWNWSYIWTALSKSPEKYGMATTPGSGILAGGFWWAVPEKAPHLECAKKFISWMLTDEFQTAQMLATGNPPSTSSVMDNKEATGKIPSFDAYIVTAKKMKVEDLDWGRELTEGLASATEDVENGKKSPQQAADWLQNVKFKGRKAIE